MRYKVFFTTGEHIYIEQFFYEEFTKKLEHGAGIFPTYWENEKIVHTINLRYVTHIVREDSLEQEGSVVRPEAPESIVKRKAEEHDKKVADPSAIIQGVKQKEEDHEVPA